MTNFHPLVACSSHFLKSPEILNIEERLGLYQIFLKLYEHHRDLLEEILDLENLKTKVPTGTTPQYVQGMVQGSQGYLVTNLLTGITQILDQSQQTWAIGRDRQATISIPDQRLSRRHAVIQYVQNQGFYLIDLNSTNGSFVNGEPVRHSCLLKDGDQIRLSSLTFTFFVCHRASDIKTEPPEDSVSTASITRSTLQTPEVGALLEDATYYFDPQPIPRLELPINSTAPIFVQ